MYTLKSIIVLVINQYNMFPVNHSNYIVQINECKAVGVISVNI